MAVRTHIGGSEELPADAYKDQYTTPGQVWQGPPDPITDNGTADQSVSGWKKIAPHFSWWFAMADVKLVDILFTFVVDLLGLEGAFSKRVAALTLYCMLQMLGTALMTLSVSSISLLTLFRAALLVAALLVRSAILRFGVLIAAAAAALADDEHAATSSTSLLPAVAHRIASRLWGPGRREGHDLTVLADSNGNGGASAGVGDPSASRPPSQQVEGATAVIRTLSRGLSRRQGSFDRHVVLEQLAAATGGLGSRSASRTDAIAPDAVPDGTIDGGELTVDAKGMIKLELLGSKGSSDHGGGGWKASSLPGCSSSGGQDWRLRVELSVACDEEMPVLANTISMQVITDVPDNNGSSNSDNNGSSNSGHMAAPNSRARSSSGVSTGGANAATATSPPTAAVGPLLAISSVNIDLEPQFYWLQGSGSSRNNNSSGTAGTSKPAGGAARSAAVRGRGVVQGKKAAGSAQQPNRPKSQQRSRNQSHQQQLQRSSANQHNTHPQQQPPPQQPE
eukprot:gene5375-5610_t